MSDHEVEVLAQSLWANEQLLGTLRRYIRDRAADLTPMQVVRLVRAMPVDDNFSRAETLRGYLATRVQDLLIVELREITAAMPPTYRSMTARMIESYHNKNLHRLTLDQSVALGRMLPSNPNLTDYPFYYPESIQSRMMQGFLAGKPVHSLGCGGFLALAVAGGGAAAGVAAIVEFASKPKP